MAINSGNTILDSDVASSNVANAIVHRDSTGAISVSVAYANCFKGRESNSSAELHASSGWYLAMQPDNNLVLYNSSGSGVWSKNSSRRTKNYIKSLTNEDMKNFNKLNIVKFDYIPEMKYSKQNNQYGLIAEELVQLYPNLVNIPTDYDSTNFDASKGINQPLPSVKYEQFIPLLIKKVQTQQDELDELEKIIMG